MWQRIQTLYLAISTVLMAIMAFGVKAAAHGPGGEVVEEVKYFEYLPYAVLVTLSLLLDVLALTTYKIRVFQMRTAVLAALIMLALQLWLAVDFLSNRGTGHVFKLTVVFPLVAVILNVLAARSILADQLLVESAYRLRDGKRRKK